MACASASTEYILTLRLYHNLITPVTLTAPRASLYKYSTQNRRQKQINSSKMGLLNLRCCKNIGRIFRQDFTRLTCNYIRVAANRRLICERKFSSINSNVDLSSKKINHKTLKLI